MSDDEQLARRLQQGDEQALAELLSLHHDRLWKLVNFRMDPRLRGRIDAEDVLQEAYLGSAQRLVHYQHHPEHSPFIWLRQIVLQTLVDVYRRHRGAQMRDVSREVSLHVGGYPNATSQSLAAQLLGRLTSPSQVAMRDEAATQLQHAIGNMSSTDQEVLALRHFEELTNGEVAELLDLTAKSASIRYVRALERLEEALRNVPGFGQDQSS